MEGTAKDNMEWWSVDDEHAQASAGEDSGKVPFVPNDRFAEGEGELGLDSEYVEALDDEYG